MDLIFFCFKKRKKEHWNFKELGIENRFSNNISFSDKFENISNEDEIYLRSYNWDFPQITTWFFYFKKVRYPYDEKIDGGWEWKEIYLGDLF